MSTRSVISPAGLRYPVSPDVERFLGSFEEAALARLVLELAAYSPEAMREESWRWRSESTGGMTEAYRWHMSETVLAALAGASLAGILTLVVQLAVAFMARSHTDAHARAKGIAEFVSATHGAVIAIGLLARQPMESKVSFREGAFYTSREDRETSALNVVQLLDPVDVVEAAVQLHSALIRLERDAQTKIWTQTEWDVHRPTILGSSVTGVFAAGRKALGRPNLERDAMWSNARAAQALDGGDE